MTQRDRLFHVIYDIKYAAIYGGLYANRLSTINAVVETTIIFLMSSAFGTVWLWKGHERAFSLLMVAVSFVQLLVSRLGLGSKSERVRIASNLLHGLYDEARVSWFRLNHPETDDQAYGECAATLEEKERQFVSIADDVVRNVPALVNVSADRMCEQVEADFGCR